MAVSRLRSNVTGAAFERVVTRATVTRQFTVSQIQNRAAVPNARNSVGQFPRVIGIESPIIGNNTGQLIERFVLVEMAPINCLAFGSHQKLRQIPVRRAEHGQRPCCPFVAAAHCLPAWNQASSGSTVPYLLSKTPAFASNSGESASFGSAKISSRVGSRYVGPRKFAACSSLIL